MADIEAAARAPPLPAPAPRRPVTAEVNPAVADVRGQYRQHRPRYAVGGGYPYAQAVVAFERDMFLRALATELLLCPFTILLLLLHLDRRPTEPPEELVLIGAGTPPCSYMVQSTLEHVVRVSALAMASYRC